MISECELFRMCCMEKVYILADWAPFCKDLSNDRCYGVKRGERVRWQFLAGQMDSAAYPTSHSIGSFDFYSSACFRKNRFHWRQWGGHKKQSRDPSLCCLTFQRVISPKNFLLLLDLPCSSDVFIADHCLMAFDQKRRRFASSQKMNQIYPQNRLKICTGNF